MNKEEFMLVQRGGANISPATAARYTELVKLMRQQHEVIKARLKEMSHLLRDETESRRDSNFSLLCI